ncbi:MAG: bifunctional [glutamine synthetase] adenylyltransferase/[glutamine synthetase]-adenylyl-L-tyrosine phosphorylase [Actinobacteria bacterium]|nr:bifunctional [glutamine synthetase] adenylyltransferase/[glutamine synthetase]-adenylyl-L-tyrosine phosphorylase [Actinomycetota bacterium]
MSDREGGRRATPEAQLAVAGLAPERAIGRLRDARLWDDEGPRPGTDDLLDRISSAAAPEDALEAVTSLAGEQPDLFGELRDEEAWLDRVISVAGASRPLGSLLAQDRPAVLALRDPRSVQVPAVADEVRDVLADADDADGSAAVAAIRRRWTCVIAARDLAGDVPVDEVGEDLAHLAEGILAGATNHLIRIHGGGEPAATLAVVGMGKLGGEELNYVSDVDVVFVHQPTDGADPDAARKEATAVCAGLLGLLSVQTPMGRAYEVDADLRPEGRDGPLTRTPDSFVSYWERWAETWEFQAMLKARPVAGDRALAEELIVRAEPFVFPERLAPDVVARVRHLKGRVEAKSEVVRHGERQLKLGPGGLRDIEFAVQLLQLVHGRADPDLRHRGTLPALAALAAGGYVADDDAETFAAAYRELRTVEHRLQLADERRTHTLPEDPVRLERLARSLGHRPQGETPARDPFLARIRAVQGEVRDLHAKLFYRPLLEAHAAVPASDVGIVASERGMDDEAAVRRLEALGFRDGAGALRDARSLTGGLTRRARTLRAVLPVMLHALADSPDPDTGMRMLRTLVESQADGATLLATLRDQPPAADLLARILGTSEVAGELLTSQPQAIEWLADPEERAEPRSREDLETTALALLRWQDEAQAGLRRFKRRELARIVIRDLAGDAGVSVVGTELAALGDACLEAGLQGVLSDLGPADTPPARIAIVGLGKLGGRELHYISDLDVVFVHEPTDGASDEEASTYAIGVAERLLASLSSVTAEGTAFEVDPELRPEGRSGPLSRSLASCRSYYERWSEPWEHQALLRARRVAGNPQVGQAFVDLARGYAYPEHLEDATELRKMKARIERERVPNRRDPERHLKLGPGGLSDVEWTVQLLQQEHGHRERMLRTPSTMRALDGLQDAGLLTTRDAQWLRAGYRFLSQVRNRLYLLRQRDVDSLPASGPVLEKLARSMGYGHGGRQRFEDDYLRHTRRVRQVTDRVFYGRED